MKIKLDENLYLESDEMQLMIKKYSGKTDKKGNETYRVLGYYGTTEQAIKSLINKRLLDSDSTSLKELQTEITKIWDEIKEKLDY